jgi:hypothetical protein
MYPADIGFITFFYSSETMFYCQYHSYRLRSGCHCSSGINHNHISYCVFIMDKCIFCFTPSSIAMCLLLALSVILLYTISFIHGAEGEPQIFEVGPNSNSTIRNSTYENSSLGMAAYIEKRLSPICCNILLS